jgi:epidermal growth factor receptor substrate 15
MSSEFTPSQAEVALTAKIFEKADTSKLGILTGDIAVNVFSGSKLPAGVLGEVWAMADRENDGFLTRKGVAIALRLMGHAQRGEPVTEALLKKRKSPESWLGLILISTQRACLQPSKATRYPFSSKIPVVQRIGQSPQSPLFHN